MAPLPEVSHKKVLILSEENNVKDDEEVREALLRMLMCGEVFSFSDGMVSGDLLFSIGANRGFIVHVGPHPSTPMGAYRVTQKGLDFIRGG
jgi:hypothetical protein